MKAMKNHKQEEKELVSSAQRTRVSFAQEEDVLEVSNGGSRQDENDDDYDDGGNEGDDAPLSRKKSRSKSRDDALAEAEMQQIYNDVRQSIIDKKSDFMDKQISASSKSLDTVRISGTNADDGTFPDDIEEEDDYNSDDDGYEKRFARIAFLKKYCTLEGRVTFASVALALLSVFFVYSLVRFFRNAPPPYMPYGVPQGPVEHDTGKAPSEPLAEPTMAPQPPPVVSDNNGTPINTFPVTGVPVSDSSGVIANTSLSETTRIGFVESPFNMDELLLLLESELGIDCSTMDMSSAQETTGGSGSTVICGIKVQEISVIVECKPNAALCSVYKVDNSFSCE
jgi:hypothetical protein